MRGQPLNAERTASISPIPLTGPARALRPRGRVTATASPLRVLVSERVQTRAVASTCLARLPEEFRSVILLHDVEALPVEQVASRLRLSVAMVEARLDRARRSLVRELCAGLGQP